MIANLVAEYPNLVVVSDEVYKFSVYDPFEEGDSFARGHYHFARLPSKENATINEITSILFNLMFSFIHYL
jgi:hypothetical protein